MAVISLNSSMRSNLLSLQAIANLQSITQNRLATGLKVNSALDNPSSFYSAVALSNRSSDLSQILSSMAQGIQALKNVSQTLDVGISFLEQAKSIAQSVLDKTDLAIHAVVGNEADLLKAIENGGSGLIVINGNITLSENQSLKLKAGQKLVGTDYLKGTDYEIASASTSGLTFNFIDAENSTAIEVAEDTLISDLKITYQTNSTNYKAYAIYNKANSLDLQNIDFDYNNSGPEKNVFGAAIANDFSSQANLYGNINIKASGNYATGIFNGKVTQDKDSFLNIHTNGFGGIGIRADYFAEGTTQIETAGSKAHGIYGTRTYNLHLGGQLKIKNSGSGAMSLYDMKLNLNKSNAVLMVESAGTIFYGVSVNAVAGSQISLSSGLYEAQNDIFNGIPQSAILPPAGFTQIGATLTTDLNATHGIAKLKAANGKESSIKNENKSFRQTLEQYDQLINDAQYKNINLLKEENLFIDFNKEKTAKIHVYGVDASVTGLKINHAAWESQMNIIDSISQIENAVKQLRSYSTQFGNSFSIISERENFTENMINILTEGVDQLTLADMNEESANMLALKTRQMLAVNSLSLASESSKAVLSLF